MFRLTSTHPAQPQQSLTPPLSDRPWFPRVEEEDGIAELEAAEAMNRERKLSIRQKQAPKPIGLG